MVHSDYSLGGAPIHIAILDDRIELENPGLLEEIALKFCAMFFTQRTEGRVQLPFPLSAAHYVCWNGNHIARRHTYCLNVLLLRAVACDEFRPEASGHEALRKRQRGVDRRLRGPDQLLLPIEPRQKAHGGGDGRVVGDGGGRFYTRVRELSRRQRVPDVHTCVMPTS